MVDCDQLCELGHFGNGELPSPRSRRPPNQVCKHALESHLGDEIFVLASSQAYSKTNKMTTLVFRCVFISNLNPSSAVPPTSLSSLEMQKIVQKDLVMNVYRDGKWGSFRHLPLQQGTSFEI